MNQCNQVGNTAQLIESTCLKSPWLYKVKVVENLNTIAVEMMLVY